MYTLRKIFQDGTQHNFYLGYSYGYVNKEESPEEFKKLIDELLSSPDDGNRVKIYAFVIPENGSTSFALFKNGANYIMNEKGGTFANVSFR